MASEFIDKYFLCTNKVVKISILYICDTNQRARLWNIYPSYKESRLRQIPGEFSNNDLAVYPIAFTIKD